MRCFTTLIFQRYYFIGGYSPDCENNKSLCQSLYYFEVPSFPKKFAKENPDWKTFAAESKVFQVPNSDLGMEVLGCTLKYNQVTNNLILYIGYQNGNLPTKFTPISLKNIFEIL